MELKLKSLLTALKPNPSFNRTAYGIEITERSV